MKLGEAGYVLTSREIAFLAALTGAEEFYGLVDNTGSLSEEELLVEWEKTRSQLEHKKYLEMEIDDSITIDEDLYALLRYCCQPELIVSCEGKGLTTHKIFRHIYLTHDMAAELDQDQLMKQKYILTPLVTPKKALTNLKECFTFSYVMEEGGDYVLPYTVFQEIMASDEENWVTVIDRVVENYIQDRTVATAFIHALKKREHYLDTTLITFPAYGGPDVYSLSIIGDGQYMWQIHVVDEEEVEVRACTIDVLEETRDAVLDKMKKTYRRW